MGAAPSGRSASLTAFITAPGAPAVPASPAPFAPSSASAERSEPWDGAPSSTVRAVPVVFFTPAALGIAGALGFRVRVGPGPGSPFGGAGLAGLHARLAADAGRARGPGAAAIGRVVGVAGDDAHALDRYAERGGRDLGNDRFGALALLGDPGLADDRALGVEPDADAVLGGNFRAADAVERGRG